LFAQVMMRLLVLSMDLFCHDNPICAEVCLLTGTKTKDNSIQSCRQPGITLGGRFMGRQGSSTTTRRKPLSWTELELQMTKTDEKKSLN